MKPLRILHFEDSAADATLVRHKIKQAGIEADIVRVTSPDEFRARMEEAPLGAIMLDNGIPGFNSLRAIELARERSAGTPVIILSGSASEKQVASCLDAGVEEYVLKGHWWQLFAALRRAQAVAKMGEEKAQLELHDRGMSRLVSVLQELSSARDLAAVMRIVLRAARQLTGAQGSAFVLHENGACHYADEDADAPLWKGRRFPLQRCICGWVMEHGKSVAVPEVEADDRIPIGAYRGTPVRSLAAAPVGKERTIGAVVVYWANHHMPERAEVEIVEALANTARVVMENLHLYGELDRRVRDRTLQLEDAVRELEAFSYSVSHDLRSPLQTIAGFAELVALNMSESGDAMARDCVAQIQSGVARMTQLIEDLLRLAQIGTLELHLERTSLSDIAEQVAADLRSSDPKRSVKIEIQPQMMAWADPGLIRVVLQNLMANAWKYTSRRERAEIAVFSAGDETSGTVFQVRDNGAGFDPASAEKLFAPFQRLHAEAEFAGTGVGLATVQRVIHRHGGRIWATGAVNAGAAFFFTLPDRPT